MGGRTPRQRIARILILMTRQRARVRGVHAVGTRYLQRVRQNRASTTANCILDAIGHSIIPSTARNTEIRITALIRGITSVVGDGRGTAHRLTKERADRRADALGTIAQRWTITGALIIQVIVLGTRVNAIARGLTKIIARRRDALGVTDRTARVWTSTLADKRVDVLGLAGRKTTARYSIKITALRAGVIGRNRIALTQTHQTSMTAKFKAETALGTAITAQITGQTNRPAKVQTGGIPVLGIIQNARESVKEPASPRLPRGVVHRIRPITAQTQIVQTKRTASDITTALTRIAQTKRHAKTRRDIVLEAGRGVARIPTALTAETSRLVRTAAGRGLGTVVIRLGILTDALRLGRGSIKDARVSTILRAPAGISDVPARA